MKIIINLSQRQLAFCYDLIKSGSYEEIGEAASSIASAIEEIRTDVEVDTSIIKSVYDKAAKLPEGYSNLINSEIKAALVPQLMPLANNEDVAQLLQDLGRIDADYRTQLDSNIQAVLATLAKARAATSV